MALLDFMTAAGNLPFSISGAFLVGLLILELVGVLAGGMGPSHLLDALDGKNHHVELGELAADALGYLHWGKVPMIVLLSSMAGLFSLAGLGVQSLMHAWTGALLPGWLASFPAGVVAVVGTHFIAKPLAALMPTDTGDAITQKDLLGLVGTVINGPITEGLPGEARVRDLKGGLHVARISVTGAEILQVGDEVVLSSLAGAFFVAARTGHKPSISNLPAAVAGGAEPKSAARTHQEH